MVTKVNPSKGRFDLAKYFQTEVKKKELKAIKLWQTTIPGVIIKNIKESIAAGNSPVKGAKRFVEYSPSYTKAILAKRYPGKKLRPVNLYLTGAMMRSLIYRPTQKGFVVYFTNKLAKIHSELGAGKSRTIRKVMPQQNERFKDAIVIESDKLVDKILKKEFNDMF